MDESLTNLVNESQNENNTYKFQLETLNITDEDRDKISKMLFSVSFIINLLMVFFSNNIYINVFCYLFSLFLVVSGGTIIYKNNDYITNNILLFGIYIISILFEIILITSNTETVLGLLFPILYQFVYVIKFE